jgi:hypothetical protein
LIVLHTKQQVAELSIENKTYSLKSINMMLSLGNCEANILKRYPRPKTKSEMKHKLKDQGERYDL